MPNLSTHLIDTRLDASLEQANDGWLEIMSGSLPANADSPSLGSVLVALRLNSPAAEPATNGKATVMANSAKATKTGKAAWYRVVKSDGKTVLWTGTVGVMGKEINLPSIDMAPGVDVEVELTVTEPQD